MNPKLEYNKVKPIKFYRNCIYCQRCQRESEYFFVVVSPNARIFEFFNISKLGGANNFYLCSECFEKLHSLLEEIESEDWETLDPDSEEFKDLDAEVALNDENGSGRCRKMMKYEEMGRA